MPPTLSARQKDHPSTHWLGTDAICPTSLTNLLSFPHRPHSLQPRSQRSPSSERHAFLHSLAPSSTHSSICPSFLRSVTHLGHMSCCPLSAGQWGWVLASKLGEPGLLPHLKAKPQWQGPRLFSHCSWHCLGLPAQSLNPPMLRPCLIHPSPSLASGTAPRAPGQAGDRSSCQAKVQLRWRGTRSPFPNPRRRENPRLCLQIACVPDEVTITSSNSFHW